jgi:hypothetical protein
LVVTGERAKPKLRGVFRERAFYAALAQLAQANGEE